VLLDVVAVDVVAVPVWLMLVDDAVLELLVSVTVLLRVDEIDVTVLDMLAEVPVIEPVSVPDVAVAVRVVAVSVWLTLVNETVLLNLLVVDVLEVDPVD